MKISEKYSLFRFALVPWFVLAFVFFVSVPFSSLAQRNTGVDFDLQGFIDGELARGNKNITIPPGVYRVTPQDKAHLSFSGLTDVTLRAEGVEMICTQTTRAITINKCRNLTISGLTIDYDPLCFTQGRITRLSDDKKMVEFRLDDNYPDGLVERIEIFNPQTLTLRRRTHYGWGQFEKTADRTYTVSKGENYVYNPAIDTEQVGDILVTNNEYAPDGSAPHAIYSNACTGLRLEDIMLYSGNCFGYFETNGTKNNYIRCRIDRREQKSDHYERAKRIRSNDADAFHSKFAYVGPQLIGCSARFQGDDGINICGKYYFSVGAKGNKISLVVPDACDLKIGNRLEILTFDGKRLPVATIVSIEEAGTITPGQIAEIAKIKQNENNKRALTRSSNKIMELTIDRSVDFGLGAVVGDRERIGSGFLIQDCNFSYNRSRGILIKASDGVITGNTLEENWMSSVLISPEAWWLESGSSDHVVVRNNTFIRNKSSRTVNVTGEGFDGNIPQAGLHNDLIITGNRFVECPLPVLYVASTQGGEVLDNEVVSPIVLSGETANDPLVLINCKKIKTDIPSSR